MAFDFKKEYREYYLPPQTPVIVDVPPINYVAVRGKGNPFLQADNLADPQRKAPAVTCGLPGLCYTYKCEFSFIVILR